MLGQAGCPTDRVPVLLSDPYEPGMETYEAARARYYDEVVYRGDPATLEFIAFWLSARGGGRMNGNVWDVDGRIRS